MIAALLLFTPLAVAQDPEPFSALDVFELEWAAEPQVSPDGSQVIFVRSGFDVMTDRTRRNLWVLDVETGDARPLVTNEQGAGSPRWSPDGGRLVYVSSDQSGASQVFCRWMDTGATAMLTHLTEGPGGLSWSPDGKWLAFTMFVASEPESLATMPPKPEGAEWAEPARVVESLRWRSDGSGLLDAGYRHVFVLPADGGTPRQVTSGDFDHGGTPTWTGDSAALIVSANRHEDGDQQPMNSELYRVPLDGREMVALTKRDGPDGAPAVSPDGKWIAYTGFDDRRQGYQLSRLYVMPSAGGEGRALLEGFDRSVGTVKWSPDSRGMYFSYDERGNTKIDFVTLQGEQKQVAADLGGTSLGRPYGSGSFSVGGGGTVAFTRTKPDRPADVAVVRGDKHRLLTTLNEDILGQRALGEVRELVVESSHDGLLIQAWIMLPPNFDASESYPLLLEIHGGPFANYGDRFTAECQLYASAGYVVVYSNPRGSTSYGEEFGNAIHHAYPGYDYDDLISVVDEVIGLGFIDPNQLFVTGGSGGGVLTAWIVGKTDRFRAAVVAKPVINWASFVLTADAYPFFTRYWFPSMPWEDPDHYWKRSPLSLVGNVSTPTMLLTGEEDHRTPISESEQFYQALKATGGRHGPRSHPRCIAQHRRAPESFDCEGRPRTGMVRAVSRRRRRLGPGS